MTREEYERSMVLNANPAGKQYQPDNRSASPPSSKGNPAGGQKPAGQLKPSRPNVGHTPGPWQAWLNRVIQAKDKDGVHDVDIAFIARPGLFTATFEQVANANLIAAAPDLLEALKIAADKLYDLAQWIEPYADPKQIRSVKVVEEDARIAIKKATE